MTLRPSGSLLTLLTSGALLMACSDDPEEVGLKDNPVGNGGSTFQSDIDTEEEPKDNPSIIPGIDDESSGGSAGASNMPMDGCASQAVQSNLEPVHLVFLLDQSGSMGDGEHGDRTEKWDPVTEALNAFFADPASKGLTASLSLFPDDVNQTSDPATSKYNISCDADSYQTPVVSPRPLPETAAFADAIFAVDPPNEFGTPTQPALAGTVAYAQTLADEGRKVAIVMVTDGKPAQCGNGNSVKNTAAQAAAVSEIIPTYVIGVGEALDDLHEIAEAGGTTEAFIVDIDDPDKTRSSLLEQVQLIRGEQISCELNIPAPPEGEELDPDKVTVELISADTAAELNYNENCQEGAGWHYNDPANPSTIELCEQTCELVQATENAAVEVVFGCTLRPDVVR